MNYQEFPPGYAEAPVFNPSFKIPVKASQPPPPGTTDAEQEQETAVQPPLPPGPPQHDMTNVFQSPMFNYDPSYWAPQAGMTYQQPHYGMPMPQVAHVAPEESRKRKLDIDYMGKDDPALPDELKKLFNALHCVLCDVKVNSPISAKMHYSSKTHEKKINQWLIDYCKRTGASMPKRQRKVTSIEEAQKAGPKGPNALFCDICQIALTSIQHANQHYMGKKHRMVAAGKSRPKSQKPQPDNTGRFGIGQAFVQPLDEPGQKASLSISPPPTPVYDATTPADAFSQSSPPQLTYATPKPGTIGPSLLPVMPPVAVENTKNQNGKNSGRYCEICDISVTSDQQMETHISGQKHQKKCKQIGITTELSPRSRSDFSSCRTPSGQYYCISCDMTVATEALYSSHIQSKKHIKNAKEKR
ncbi:zinc finger protein 385C-like isoform X2 [Culicoides brevitarsis]|uniref:zinc finger protein 385C-like isoform X2 n=1 Tax=Culicoides brevitarsis TaxID=469753 RepID=UPI00307BC795